MKFREIRNKGCIALLLVTALLAGPELAVAGSAARAGAPEAPSALPVAPVPMNSAQEPQGLEALRLQEPEIHKTFGVKTVEGAPSRRKWIALGLAEHAAAGFDALTTEQAIGRGAVEGDPLMRPVAGSPRIYAAIQLAPLALDYAARRMQRSANPSCGNSGGCRKPGPRPCTFSRACTILAFRGGHSFFIHSPWLVSTIRPRSSSKCTSARLETCSQLPTC